MLKMIAARRSQTGSGQIIKIRIEEQVIGKAKTRC